MRITDKIQIEQLREKIERMNVAIVTTVNEQGRPHGRPMYPVFTEEKGAIYFFTEKSSAKLIHLYRNPQVSLFFANEEKGEFTEVWGTVEFMENSEHMQNYWHPYMNRWLRKGGKRAEIVVLKVAIEEAECWSGNRNKPVQMLNVLPEETPSAPALSLLFSLSLARMFQSSFRLGPFDFHE